MFPSSLFHLTCPLKKIPFSHMAYDRMQTSLDIIYPPERNIKTDNLSAAVDQHELDVGSIERPRPRQASSGKSSNCFGPL
jgi:hypothetical protein